MKKILPLLLVILILSACQERPGPMVENPDPSSTLTVVAKEESTQTPIISGMDPVSVATLPSPEPTQPHDTKPLRFTFPTPGAQPISLWRPPLYSVPWALGEHDHFLFIRPIAADEVNWPLANYRYGGNFTGTVIHTGVDIDAKLGTPVMAAGAGIVIWAGYGLFRGEEDAADPYGNAVAIRHDFGYQGRKIITVYGHMNRVDVIPGQWVDAGTQIGIVGSTGNSTGPHLHFEVRLQDLKNGYYFTRNPELWLAPPQGWGVLVGKVEDNNGFYIPLLPVEVTSKDTGQVWHVTTYGTINVTMDEYYKENLVLSDLPAGNYTATFSIVEKQIEKIDFSINPGAITYFSFKGGQGFTRTLPSDTPPTQWLVTPVTH